MPVDKVLYYGDDKFKDDNLQEITLYYSVPHQIDPKTIPEKGKAFAIWRNTLPGYDEYHPADEDGGCCL
jgi:hypothetical protein